MIRQVLKTLIHQCFLLINIMCGALDVALLNERLRDRNIVAARATGVRTIEELLEAPLESVTYTAEDLGIVAGMTGREAILRMM